MDSVQILEKLKTSSMVVPFGGERTTYNSGSGLWEDPTVSDNNDIVAQWLGDRRHRAGFPGTIVQASQAILPSSGSVNYIAPQVITMNLEPTDELKLKDATVLAITNIAGTPQTLPAISYDAEGVTIDTTGLTAYQRIYLTAKSTIAIEPGMVSGDTITISELKAVHGIVDGAGDVDRSYDSVSYTDDETIITYAGAAPTSGDILVENLTKVNIQVQGESHVKIGVELPVKWINNYNVVEEVTWRGFNGETTITVPENAQKSMDVLVPSWFGRIAALVGLGSEVPGAAAGAPQKRMDARNVTFDNEDTGLIGDTVQDVIEELVQVQDENTSLGLTLYVDAVRGNDTSGNGSAISPFLTVQKAFDAVATLEDPGQSKMSVQIVIGPGRFNEEIDWTIPYNWGGSDKSLRLSVQGSGGTSGTNTTYLRSLTVNHHGQSGVSTQLDIDGITFDPESSSPDYGFTFVDHSNRDTSDSIKFHNSQVWAGGTGRGSVHVDATSNGEGSGFLSVTFIDSLLRGIGDATGAILMETGRLVCRETDLYFNNTDGITLLDNASISVRNAYVQMSAGDATDYNFIEAGAGTTVDVSHCTAIMVNNGHFINHTGTYTPPATVNDVQNIISSLENTVIVGAGTGGINAAAGALVAHRETVTDAGLTIPINVASPLLSMMMSNSEEIRYDNSVSGLTSGNVKEAIDELAGQTSGTPFVHVVAESESTAGFITLPFEVTTPGKLLVYRSGIALMNKQIVGGSGAAGDYDILNDDELHINNNGAATDLSGSISKDDVLTIIRL